LLITAMALAACVRRKGFRLATLAPGCQSEHAFGPGQKELVDQRLRKRLLTASIFFATQAT